MDSLKGLLVFLGLFELIIFNFVILAELSEEMANDDDERHVEHEDLNSQPVVFGGSTILPAFLVHSLEVTDLHED